MPTNSSFSWTVFQGVLFVAQTPGFPDDADWSEYLANADAELFSGVLVIGHGNKLTATQRGDVEKTLKRHGASNAVVSDSVVTRGVLTALGWFGIPVRAFAATNLIGALDYLHVSRAHRNEALALVAGLQRSLAEQPGPPTGAS